MCYSEKNMKRKLSKVLYLQIFVLTFQVQETFLLCLVQAFEFSNFLPDHQKNKSKFNFEGRTQCRELPLCAGSGKGVSGKPYPRLCNARRPRLEPGTFRSQAVRLYRLHQARPSTLKLLKKIQLNQIWGYAYTLFCFSRLSSKFSNFSFIFCNK